MKIDWGEAPEWANYAAMDADGSWYWYECKPDRLREFWIAGGRVVPMDDSDTGWRDSLQERPK